MAAGAATAWVPLCMDLAEHAAWMAANQRLSSDRAPRPCTDCPLGFAAEMRAIGRCNGTPGGVEEDDEMDEIVTEHPAARPTRAVRIAVTAPCPGCTHQQVCRIADEVRAIEATSVQVPKVGTGLALELSAAVSCEFFAPERRPGRPRKDGASPSGGTWTDERRAAQAERVRESNARRAAVKA